MPIKHWKIKSPEEALVTSLAQQAKLPVVMTRVLTSRGYDTPEKIQAFFSVEEKLSDPFALKDMEKAVQRIVRAVNEGEKIAVYGDYDCDGIMATVLVYSYLETIGADVCYYIPQRDREGYGLNKEALKLVFDSGVRLVITVDNGITAIEEIEYASLLGLDVVITDHHKPREVIPQAVAVVDPHRLEDESGCEYLAGVGVAFKLVCALEGEDSHMMLDQYGDLVAVATVADIVPLIGENRLIVRRGLQILQETENAGLAALAKVCGLGEKTLSCENIAFTLVPRINSAGRFDQVDKAVELLLCDDQERAEELAVQINSLNEKRRQIEDQIVVQILEKLEQSPQITKQRVIVIYGENWHHGIVGIVASRMVERFGKPCIVLSVEGEIARGSARSVDGFSIIDAIHACSQQLTRYGGHNQAAGLTLYAKDLDQFISSINAWAQEHYPQMPLQSLTVDCDILPSELTIDAIAPISMLEPFGSGNEAPLFQIRQVLLQGIYPIGDGKHLRLRFAGGNTVFYAVYFGMTQQSFPYTIGETLDLAASLEVNEYNGEERLSIKIKDIHLCGLDYDRIHQSEQIYQQVMRKEELETSEKEEIVPSREDIAVVYRYLRSKRQLRLSDEVLYSKLRPNISCLCKMKIAIDVLSEMELIQLTADGSNKNVTVVENPQKVDISTSKILQSIS